MGGAAPGATVETHTRSTFAASLTTFIGRTAELARLDELFALSRIVTVTGPGGSGKTRIAVEWAGRSPASRFVDLAPVSDGTLLPAAVGASLGIDQVETVAALCAVVRRSPQPLLLILDNCEHLIDAAASAAEAITRSSPNVRVLATSRESLGVPGEHLLSVGPLPLTDAVRLFSDRARAVRPDVDIGSQPGRVATICSQLDCLPLALELAASRTRSISLDELASGLTDRFALLNAGSRTAHPRQRTLEASVAWSFELLDDDDRAFLCDLSVFAGTFDLEAASSVSASAQAMRHLHRLVERSLVVVEDAEGHTCYRLLDTIRHFAAAQLGTDRRAEDARGRHAKYYLSLLARLAPGPGDPERAAVVALRRDIDNVRGALAWALAADTELALEIAARLGPVLMSWGRAGEARRWLEPALAGTDGAPAVRVAALLSLGWSLVFVDDFESGRRSASEALEIAHALGDTGAESEAKVVLAAIATNLAAFDEANRLASEVVDLSTLDERVLAFALRILAVTHLLTGRFDASCGFGHRAAGLAHRTDAREIIAQAVALAATARALQGACDAAEALVIEARSFSGSGETYATAVSHLAASVVASHRGDTTRAFEEARRALALYEDAGATAATPYAMSLMGRALCDRGDLDDAHRWGNQALSASEGIGLNESLPFILGWLGETSRLLGRSGDAATHWRRCLSIAEVRGDRFNEAAARRGLGRLARAEGDQARAETEAYGALQAFDEVGAAGDAVETLEEIAGLLVESGSAEEAVRIFAAADAARSRHGWARRPVLVPAYESELERARQALGPRFAQEWDAGLSIVLADAVAYAGRGRGRRRRPPSGWASLTPTEQRVARLVASGRSNPQIARELFVSLNTVKTHLTHVFAKLGVSSRAEVAALVTRHSSSRVR